MADCVCQFLQEIDIHTERWTSELVRPVGVQDALVVGEFPRVVFGRSPEARAVRDFLGTI